MRYRAFISYSHADEAWARWLMRRLETYRVPSRLVGEEGIDGPIPVRLGAFFRDRDELTAAGDLGATIRAALADSAALIVVCSPAAAQSRWVGAEVQAFRDSGRGHRILAFVVDGEPGQAAGKQACFPPLLITPGEDGRQVEPLAADARPVADGRERAFLKLVAGLLGVGYDDLAKRDAHRRQRRLMQVAVASLAGMTLAIGLAATAYVARNDAQRRQAQAEDILGFMLGDLREKLTTVGRLDLMRAVDNKASEYFTSLDPRDLSDRALEEQARLLTGIGQVRLKEGNHAKAMAAFREAHARSTALHERAPDNGQRLFDLAQAEYWIGHVSWKHGRLDEADVWFRKYLDSAIRLAATDQENFDWQREVAYGHHNLAVLDASLGRYTEAERALREELSLFQKWMKLHPGDTSLRYEASEAASWLGQLMLQQGRLREAEAFFSETLHGFERNISAEPDNTHWKNRKVASLVQLAEAQALQAKIVQAKSNINTACDLASILTRQDSSNNAWRSAKGICRWWQAKLEMGGNSNLAAEIALDATQLLSEYHRAEPKDEGALIWLVRAHQLQAQLAILHNDLESADLHVSAAVTLVEPVRQAKQSERLRLCLAATQLLQADFAVANGDMNAAMKGWKMARQMLADSDDPIPFLRLDPLVRALLALGRDAEAAPHLLRLDAAGYVPLQPWPLQDVVTAR